MAFNKLLELNVLAKQEGEKYVKKRALFETIAAQKGKHFTGIVGPRGVGKTVILKQLLFSQPSSFYISADTLENEDDLFEIAKILTEKMKTEILLLDEVHFQKEFEKTFKKIFDFLNVQIVFTSSVSLSLLESSYDLSRRVKLISLYPFSFKEYLYFKKETVLPSLSLEEILRSQWTPRHLEQAFLFEEYLKGGLFPFALEEPEVLPLFKNILKKIIQKDIPSVTSLKTEELSLIEKTVEFVGRSPVDGINFTSVSKNLGITKYKAEDYLRLLEKAFVLNLVFPAGTNVLKEPKVLMCLPYRLLYKNYEEALGPLREDFFAEALRMRGVPFHYLKTNRGAKTPDFLVKHKEEDWVFEVGGKGKGRQQFKGIESKNKIILSHASDSKIEGTPLVLLGFT